MKNILYSSLILTVTLISNKVAAQDDFFRHGTEWYYGFNSPGLIVAKGFTKYKCEKDTIIEGQLLKKLSRTTFYFDVDEPTIPIDTIISSPRFFKESGDSILSYNDGDLTLHWVNGLEAGDVFQIDEGWDPTGDSDLVTMVIDSTEDIVIGGIPVTKTYLHGGVLQIFFGDTIFINHSGNDIIYNKFGPAGGFGYWACWGFYDCPIPSLCRYVSNETGVVDIPTGYHCETLLTSTSAIPFSMCNIYPNPFNDYIRVYCSNTISNLTFELFNQEGILLLSKSVSKEDNIDVSILSVGIYFYRMTDGNSSVVGKLVKN